MNTLASQTLIFQNSKALVTCCPNQSTPENTLGVIPNGILVCQNGKLVWIGRSEEFNPTAFPGAETIDCRDWILLPGLIDSHTHPIFAGDRADEFEQRLQGASYLDIAAAGGGIQKTVKATRAASEADLYSLAKQRFLEMLQFGVTTVEAKSGYGLDWESELKSLRVLQQLQQDLPLDIRPTFMGAHDIPPEYKGEPDRYVDQLCTEQLPQVTALGLAEFCDVFCEKGYFDVPQSRRILETARSLGLKLKIHAEEFCTFGGAQLAGELGALSADHLLHIDDAGIQAMKTGGTVATLLPGTAFYLRIPSAPARKILEAGVPVAIATDFNPGSCMSNNLQLMMTLSCLNMNMTPAEVILGVTRHAAQALGLSQDRGSLSIGKRADITAFQADSYQELLYHFGINKVRSVWVKGDRVFSQT